jgi:hypothetical protein
MLKRFAVAGLVAAVMVVDGEAHASNFSSRQGADNFWALVGDDLLANQPQPGGAQLLDQGGGLDDKSAPAPLTEPGPNFQIDDAILQQEGNIARQQANSDMIREAQDEDLVTDDFVGNPNYFDATGGQQFGDEAFWAWPEGGWPYTVGF